MRFDALRNGDSVFDDFDRIEWLHIYKPSDV